MDLYDLASLILILNQGPISRVRFSRTIYFVHKELIRKKIMHANDIAYLRLPLGPVPEGFMSLAANHPDILIRPLTDSNLSYEAEEFVISAPEGTKAPSNRQQLQRAIERTLLALKTHPTSELVTVSHDPSWLTHKNGERYFLTAADLRNTFPYLTIPLLFRLKHPTNNEIGLLQATLLRGMLNDIVRESTDLEYPDETQSQSQLQPQSQSQPPSKTRKSNAKGKER